jgi:glycerate-2-kinase
VLAASQASAEDLAAEYVALVGCGRPCVYVRAAEPSVAVRTRTPGRGGRSSHVAALVAQAIGSNPRVRFAALASDGVAGNSGTAGASLDGRFAEKVAEHVGLDALARAIAAFDTGALHARMKTAVKSAPTGQNLADLHILVVP